ncbi:MAG: primosomal protein N' [Candidatus Margulisbacteria bacterium]|jgi:primosomal protein N' (replication factor Y)|nr:primosomal protein N' [Candidatus Margulisiibacteriota bacterium]
MFAEVVISRTASDLDKSFTYAIPETLQEEIKLGSAVVVPFGRRRDVGYVVGFVEQCEFKGIKEIISLAAAEPVFSEQAVQLARWMADYYLSFFLTALRLVMPPGIRKIEARRAVAKRETSGEKRQADAQRTTHNDSRLATALRLTDEQAAALKEITTALDAGQQKTFLLHGITGSGKTEVYLQAIAHILPKGESAIVLVPEISLTPQMIRRFSDRFGDLAVIIHSELKPKERAEAWRRVMSNEVRIVMGTRSALFAPVKNLGLIVLDEEYEHTYKSDKSPRYHANEVALELAKLHNAVVVYGSATPSLETYYRAEQGEFTRLVLPKRIDDRPLPPVTIVDLRAELKAGNFGVLSQRLSAALKETLENGQQAILFMNRLGYFTFVMCRDCGLTLQCPDCAVSLVYHTSDKQVRCSRCGHARPAPAFCPRCNSSSIRFFGTGTQRIEDEVAKLFPAARILRYDRDTVGQHGSHEKFFAAFAAGEADVMIGTQMVTKGLDIANVTLVGVISADTALSLPDFRSAEHTFQLLTQVAGRAGRHHLPGQVIIQSYNPEHYAIKAAAKHDYDLFYRRELEHRRELMYPPFTRLISVTVTAAEEKKAAKLIDQLADLLTARLKAGVLGPAPAPISRLRGEWRYHLLLKGTELTGMRSAVREVLAKAVIPADVKLAIDVEPLSLL